MSKHISTLQIIDIVKSHPVIYDMTHPEFKNTFLKNKLWEEIGGQLKTDGEFNFLLYYNIM